MDVTLDTDSSNPLTRVVDSLLEAPDATVLAISVSLVVVVAILDWLIHSLSFGVLYCVPIVLASTRLKHWQVLVFAALCAVLRESFAPFGWGEYAVTVFVLVFTGLSGVGLFACEVARNRKLTLSHLNEMREQVARRREAEQQLRTLIETSPAAIVTLDGSGRVELANRAAHALFGFTEGELQGREIGMFLPVVNDVVRSEPEQQPYRTATSCRARRVNGESFLACVWFATYPTRSGTRLAAIVTDASEDLRDWQETSLQNLLRSTRVLVGSVSHEIRNICAAISMVHANLGRVPGVAQTEDYAALATLAAGLTRLSTLELQAAGDISPSFVDLNAILDELRIILAPQLESDEVALDYRVPDELPLALGDHHGLLQVFLNLARNSLRAMEQETERRLSIEASINEGGVLVRLRDTGPGVANPERLFQAFQEGADAVGLGLFVSRAIVRACDGELYHERTPHGCSMCIQLRLIHDKEAATDVGALERTA
jgi:two-component system, LuxR family, sensor kinase FixL